MTDPAADSFSGASLMGLRQATRIVPVRVFL